MHRILISAGNWKLEQNRWNWHVDPVLGCRSIVVSEDVDFDMFLSMMYEDFAMDPLIFKVKLSYVSDALMYGLPLDTPPIFVTNERQFRGYVEEFGNEAIRLCAEFGRSGPGNGEKDLRKTARFIDPFLNIFGSESTSYDRCRQNSSLEEEDLAGCEDADTGIRFDCCEDLDGASSGDEELYGVQRLFKEQDTHSYHNFDDFLDIQTRSHTIAVGQKYETKEELVSWLKVCSVLHRFDFDVVSSTRKLLVVKCWVENCGWILRASRRDNASSAFYIRRYVGEHTCSVTERLSRSRKASSAVLGRLYLEFVGGVGPSVLPLHVAEAVQKRFGIKVPYWKAHRTLKVGRALLNGTAEEGYAVLPSYLYMVRRDNPGTIVKLEVDGDDRFKFLFISFDASIRGFPYMRKVVVVDGTFLQAKYKGTLLTACMQDGNLQIFPIAFSVVDNESDESWEWFFGQLNRVIPDDQELAIISDRHKSIANAINKVYPLAARGICTYHLRKNIISRSKKEGFKLFKKAATAYRHEEFDVIFSQIEATDPRLHAYLKEADIHMWSRAYFPANRYNLTTSNIAESINYAVYEARFWPIVQLVDAIRSMLTRWFAERRAKALATTTILTPAIEKLFEARIVEARRYKVQSIDEDVAVVTGFASSHVVKLKDKSCTCRRFDLDKIPCVHALAAADSCGHSVIDLTDPYYYTSYLYHAYQYSVMPRDVAIPVPEDVATTVCLPPVVRNQPGRPKKKRAKSWTDQVKEPKKPRKKTMCSRCKSWGHNVRTCRAEV